jgi:hypothetical protein
MPYREPEHAARLEHPLRRRLLGDGAAGEEHGLDRVLAELEQRRLEPAVGRVRERCSLRATRLPPQPLVTAEEPHFGSVE